METLEPRTEPNALTGKVVLITGGTTGIGRATAERFLSRGARVIVTGQDEARLEQTRAALGENALVLQWDVRRSEDGPRVAELIARRFGSLDAAFFNAGVARIAPLEQVAESAFDDEMNINVKGVILGVKALLPVLRDGSSLILNASVAATRGSAALSVYSATKGAICAFGKSLAVELAPRGIRVNTILPGPTMTPIQAKFGLPENIAQASYASTVAKIPLGRFGEAREVAALVLFLASSDASFITGAEIAVDGGMSAQV